jgi:hypothetical protein
LFPQAVIKEKVEIKPKFSKAFKTQALIGGDTCESSLYINFGGTVTLTQYSHGDSQRWKLYDENLGLITDVSPVDQTDTTIGIFPQWYKFSFYLQDSLGNISYPSDDPLSFDPSSPTGGPYPMWPEFYWVLTVNVDYSLAAMPPPEILATRGNPFVPCQSFKPTVKGRAFALVQSVNFSANDELWIQTPHSKLLGNNSTIAPGDTIDLGNMAAGDSLLLYLRSSNTVVSGLNLYPRYSRQYEELVDGYVNPVELDFDDWTDLYFGNLTIQILYKPDPAEYTGPIAVTMTPDSIAPGDTVQLSFKRKYLDGTLEDFLSTDTFELGVIHGCAAGSFLVNDMEGEYFDGVSQPVMFVAGDNLKSDSAVVKVRVGVDNIIIPCKIGVGNNKIKDSNTKENLSGTIHGSRMPIYTNKGITLSAGNNNLTRVKPVSKPPVSSKKEVTGEVNKPNESPDKTASAYCCGGNFYADTWAYQNIIIKNENTIPLGGWKYYQARVVKGKLEIDNVTPNNDSAPKITNGGIAADVWGDSPVSSVNPNETAAVYWEKSKPIPNKNQNLATGLIRLVGRYWQAGNTNKVVLTATYNSQTASLEIEVTKPLKLGKKDIIDKINCNQAEDVFGNKYSIDDSCDSKAGRSGIPPQLIKAQMFKESGFQPAYRYEPWIDLDCQINPISDQHYFGSGNKFVVTTTSMGSGASIPSNHIYFYQKIGYPTHPETIGQIIANNFSQYWLSSNVCYNNKTDQPNIYKFGGRDITSLFKGYYNNGEITKKNAINLTKQTLKGNTTKYNIIAQSRIIASYGPFQQTYYNAFDWNLVNYYAQNFYPEMLNEPNPGFDAYLLRILRIFSKGVKNKFPQNVNFNGNNWVNGYEGTWYNYEKTYDSGINGYEDQILNYYFTFLPQ